MPRRQDPAQRLSKRVNGEGSVARQPRPDGLWVARYSVVVDGLRRRPVLYGHSREEVVKKLREALIARDRGQRPAPARETVGAYLARWQDGRRTDDIRPTSWERDGICIRLQLTPRLGPVSLSRLRASHIRQAYAALIRDGVSRATVRRAHQVLHRALEQAVEDRDLQFNPAHFVKSPSVPRHEFQPLNEVEARQLLEAARDDPAEALYVLALTTGLRQGELLALRWSDIELDRRVLHVRRSLGRVASSTVAGRRVLQEPKTETSRRRVQLSDRAVEALGRQKLRQAELRVLHAQEWEDRGLVFTNQRGDFIDRSDLRERYGRLLDRAGLPRIRFHDLRHTFATLHLGARVPLEVTSKMLGHSTIAVTADLYQHVDDVAQRQAVDALDSLLG